jgi:hypothetical protein
VLLPHPYVLLRCDACGMLAEPSLRGAHDRTDEEDVAPAGSGLLVFARGDEVRREEPPLCARCSVAIGVTALVRWAEEEEEG